MRSSKPLSKPEKKQRAENRAESISSTLARFDSLPGSAFLRLPVVKELLGVSAATIHRMVKAGLLEPPERIGARSSGYKVSSIRKVLGSKQ